MNPTPCNNTHAPTIAGARLSLVGSLRSSRTYLARRTRSLLTERGREFGADADDCVSSGASARNASPWTLAFTGRGHCAPTWAGLAVSSLADVCRG